MANATPTSRFRFWLWLIALVGVIVPRRLRADWRQEWEAELRYREALLADWDKLNWQNKLDLLRRSTSAFWDALWLQPKRLEDEMFQDLRFGVRMLLKHKGFTAVAVLTLALGIGANTAIFSVINTLMLRSLPVAQPGELVLLSVNQRVGHEVFGRPGHSYTFSYPLYEQLRDRNRGLTGLFAAGSVSKRRLIASGLGSTETEFIRAQEVTGNFFSVLGAAAVLGRTLTQADDQAGNPQPVAVISHGFWQRRFGADPAVVGKTIVFEDAPLTIVGVAPPGFFGIEVGANPDLWWPMQLAPRVDSGPWARRLKEPDSWWLRVMGRVPAGGNRRQVQAELDVIFQQHLAEFAATRASKWSAEMQRFIRERNLELMPGNIGWTRLRQQFRQPLFILMAVAGLVLLIACANVASLLLARAAARQHEFSMRSALGAGRLRLVRQLLTESLLLAALGALLGLLLAQWGTQALLALLRLQGDPISFNVAPDARVLLFTTAAALLTGLLFGLAPALRSSRIDLAADLKGTQVSVAGGGLRQRLNQSLVVTQVALSLVLLIGAVLFVRTLEKLKGQDAGFNRENVVLFDLAFTTKQEAARRASLYKDLLARLEALPGVRAASLSTFFLLSGGGWSEQMGADGYAARPGEDLNCQGLMVSPRFFETLGTPILQGRDLGPQDERPALTPDANAPRTALINQTMARRYFGNANPVGRHIHFLHRPQEKFEIVGVAADMKSNSLREPPPPTYYLPVFRGTTEMQLSFALRTTGEAGALMAGIQAVVREADASVQVRDLRTMNELVNASIHQERVLAKLGGFFSLFALALACLGLYGVLSFSVVQRTREIGLRIALGAQAADVISLVVSQGLKLVLLGLALGLMAALVLMRFVASLLYGVTATDPPTFIGVSLSLLLIGVLASWLPARRAARTDPMTALRHD
ncbi:MAG: ABC transporter permease [Blastocatellia bacterium]